MTLQATSGHCQCIDLSSIYVHIYFIALSNCKEKYTLSSLTIQKQAAQHIWPTGHSLLIPDLWWQFQGSLKDSTSNWRARIRCSQKAFLLLTCYSFPDILISVLRSLRTDLLLLCFCKYMALCDSQLSRQRHWSSLSGCSHLCVLSSHIVPALLWVINSTWQNYVLSDARSHKTLCYLPCFHSPSEITRSVGRQLPYCDKVKWLYGEM